eukprot:TRINITY_DN7357_c0_g1_i4.p1 TRINITY_DN7357_c0_g1~~TRINITY_DN7357_c0_g1_i4.p1  ORF type:complete len:577 (-),score=173.81 TRINITY_DN7357_c0_g1_i4:1280-3010(-)
MSTAGSTESAAAIMQLTARLLYDAPLPEAWHDHPEQLIPFVSQPTDPAVSRHAVDAIANVLKSNKGLSTRFGSFPQICLERLNSHMHVNEDSSLVAELVAAVLRGLYISYSIASASAIKSMDQMRLTELVSAVLLWAGRPFKSANNNTEPTSPARTGPYYKVQLRSAQLLQLLATRFPRKLFTHWPAFFPFKKKPKRKNAPEVQSVLGFVCGDTDMNLRNAAVKTCVALFTGSFAFLASARPKNELGQMLDNIHKEMLGCLQRDSKSPEAFPAVQGAFNCLVALVPNCPYHRLDPSVLAQLLDTLASFLDCNDNALITAALPCINALMSTKQQFEAVEMRLLPRPRTESLIQQLTKLACCPTQQRTIRVEALNCVSTAATSYFSAVTSDWQLLLGSAKFFASERDDQVRNGFGKQLAGLCLGCASVLEDKEASQLARRDASLMLERVIHAGITESKLHKDNNATIRATTVEMLYNLGGGAFEALSNDMMEMVLNVVLRALADKQPPVRQAAFRAGGSLIRNGLSHSHEQFVRAVMQKLVDSKDEAVLSVRVRACWALANALDLLSQPSSRLLQVCL